MFLYFPDATGSAAIAALAFLFDRSSRARLGFGAFWRVSESSFAERLEWIDDGVCFHNLPIVLPDIASVWLCVCTKFLGRQRSRCLRSCAAYDSGFGDIEFAMTASTTFFDPSFTKFYKQNNTPKLFNTQYYSMCKSIRWFSGKLKEIINVSDRCSFVEFIFNIHIYRLIPFQQ